MQRSPMWRGEFQVRDGNFVPCSETFGDLTVLPKMRLPAGRSRQTCDLLYCAFDEAFVAGVGDELDGKPSPPFEKRSGLTDRAISGILGLLLAELESGGTSGLLYVDSLAHALAVRFLFLGHRQPRRSDKASTLSQRKLLRVQDMIESRLETDLPLRELAAEVGYSRSHFLRVFRATIGMPPHRYVLKRRIERARHLLKHTEINIAEIACTCGFSSQAHLTLAFKKECGVTPAEYRRQA
jgi:AraC family transcriptional regulator